MDSNIIKFRLSPDFLQLLESTRNEDESLHQVAKRILENNLKNGTQNQDTAKAEAGHTEKISGTQSHDHDTTFDPDVLKEQLKAELREELAGSLNELVKINLDEISKKLTA
jgi:hypothetical protein